MGILTSESDFVRATSSDWQAEMKSAIRDVAELRRLLGLPVAATTARSDAESQFSTFVPQAYLARIEKGNPDDPLLRQVMPSEEELAAPAGYSCDPLHEFTETATCLQGSVLKKYSGRALFVLTGVCAVHCRYCFRRHFPYQLTKPSRKAWQSGLETISGDPQCQELILSGGDPLSVVDDQLEEFLIAASRIAHLRRIRIHTRLPLVIPNRVTTALCRMLDAVPLPVCLVWHVNHARELDRDVAAAAGRLRSVGNLSQLNQSVLLRGVNDSLLALQQLSESLFEIGIVPYYLHQLDRVQGAAHFEVPIEEGCRLIRELRTTLPGYLVPRYVQELPGEPNKAILA